MSPYSLLQSPLRNSVLLSDPCTSTIPTAPLRARDPTIPAGARPYPIPPLARVQSCARCGILSSSYFGGGSAYRCRDHACNTRPQIRQIRDTRADLMLRGDQTRSLRSRPSLRAQDQAHPRPRPGPVARFASRLAFPAIHETRYVPSPSSSNAATHSILCAVKRPLRVLAAGKLAALRISGYSSPILSESALLATARSLSPARPEYVRVRSSARPPHKRKGAIPKPQILIPLPNTSSFLWRCWTSAPRRRLRFPPSRTCLTPTCICAHGPRLYPAGEEPAHTPVIPPRVGCDLIAPPRPARRLLRMAFSVARPPDSSDAPSLSYRNAQPFVPWRAATTPHHKLLFLRAGRRRECCMRGAQGYALLACVHVRYLTLRRRAPCPSGRADARPPR
ncbi:hypothetical protein C8J57DRAFT_1515434 [Mycena rebaudengoi]|nr:hypothetical protein C8J57DRAFT_1515434 [Mycena rebaudengoi]